MSRASRCARWNGTTQVITITINGTNDGAVIGGTVTGAVTEDVSVTGGELVVTGALTISDADAGQASFQTSAGSISGRSMVR